jgi:V/A-type H+-transporting ATPase subunit I
VILPMAKVQLLGPRERLQEALAFLQARGVLQLRSSAGGEGEAGGTAVRPVAALPDAERLAAALSEAAERCAALRARLPVRPDERPERLPDPGGEPLRSRLAALEQEVDALLARRGALVEEAEVTARFERLVVALAPFRHRLEPALAPEIHGLFLRDDAEALALLAREVDRITGGRYDLDSRPLGDGQVGILLTIPRSASRDVGSLLFAQGVEEVPLPPGFAGRPIVDVLLLLAERRRAIPTEIASADQALGAIAAAFGAALQGAERRAREALARLAATGQCGETRFAFVISGWTPEEQVAPLREATERELGGAALLLAHAPVPAEWGAVPVVLRNPPALRPFQLLLGLVPLPRYGSVDPTPFLAVTFPLFFGFVLGDAAFGFLAAAAALVARRAGWGGRLGRDVAAVALACAGSSLLFGLLFGEALGDVGAAAGLAPLLLHRRHEVLGFLALAVAVGGLHVAIGAALGAWTALRAGRRRAGIGRVAKLGLLLAGGVAALALAGVLGRPALLGGLAAVALLLLVALVAEGPMAALDLVLGLGNVLSYSRLMALGLASAMLADVANAIGRTLAPRPAGIAIGVLLHLVNFSLGLVSPAVAALRLHYVEFFERFYEEGGEPFRPFALTG